MPRDESGERAERDLSELYKQREELADGLKFAPPEMLPRVQEALRIVDAEIAEAEASIAGVESAVPDHDKAPDIRRRTALVLLPQLAELEKGLAGNEAALNQIAATRTAALKFLLDDATDRGIPNDDH
ncbi:MAG TPA: hypothetical protein PLL77_02775 [Pyrinomonadaceae bacterium]|nr:hypothetical protein [Pyrinomonadaceae bacterium]